MRTLNDWLTLYARDHQNPLNKKIHWICVPVILFTILGLLSAIPLPWTHKQPWLNPGAFAFLFSLMFYARLSIVLALGFFVFGGSMLAINWLLMAELGMRDFVILQLAAFVIAWIFQFIGHKVEGQKPAFFEDLQFLLIGPAWVMTYIFDRINIPYNKQ